MLAKIPPRPGPKIKPPLKAADSQPITLARSLTLVRSAARAIEVGTNMAADSPSTARDRSKSQSRWDSAKTNSAMEKTSSPQTSIGFRPVLSEIRPTIGEAINWTKAKRDDITPMSKAEKWYSFLINGITGKIRLIPRQIRNSQKITTAIMRLTSLLTIDTPFFYLDCKRKAVPQAATPLT